MGLFDMLHYLDQLFSKSAWQQINPTLEDWLRQEQQRLRFRQRQHDVLRRRRLGWR